MPTLLSRFFLAVLLTANLFAQSAPLNPSASPSQTTPPNMLAPASEPPNLGQLKTELKSYHDCTCECGCYATSLDQQANAAIAILERRVAQKKGGEKLALVLDIDETSLSNYQEMAGDDFGFIPRDWDAWAETAKAPAIPGILRLYQRAEELGVAVFFITGRQNTLRAATEANLRHAGYAKWDGLTLRAPDQAHQPTIAYKSAARAQIVQQGYRIILNVGDQWSDLKGDPAAEFSVKLPDPFYYIP